MMMDDILKLKSKTVICNSKKQKNENVNTEIEKLVLGRTSKKEKKQQFYCFSHHSIYIYSNDGEDTFEKTGYTPDRVGFFKDKWIY